MLHGTNLRQEPPSARQGAVDARTDSKQMARFGWVSDVSRWPFLIWVGLSQSRGITMAQQNPYADGRIRSRTDAVVRAFVPAIAFVVPGMRPMPGIGRS